MLLFVVLFINLPVSEHSPLNRPYMVPYKTNVDMVAILDFYTYPNILRMSTVARTVPCRFIL